MEKGFIGIVGGMGPNAGISLSRNIVCQTIAIKDQEHLPQILYSFPGYITDRSEYLTGKTKINPGYNISHVLIKMEIIGVNYAAMACNFAHAPQIFDIILSELMIHKSKIRLLHIIDEVGKFIKEEYADRSKVGILGTTGTYLTHQYDLLHQFGLSTKNISVGEQESLHNAIYNPEYGIKSNAGNVPEETRKLLNDCILSLINGGAELIVLGCTELPLVFSEPYYNGIPVIDSSVVLARALIKIHSPSKLKEWIK